MNALMSGISVQTEKKEMNKERKIQQQWHTHSSQTSLQPQQHLSVITGSFLAVFAPDREEEKTGSRAATINKTLKCWTVMRSASSRKKTT